MSYSAKDFLKSLAETADDVASDLVDANGTTPPIAKDYSQLAATFEDLAKGRPFLM